MVVPNPLFLVTYDYRDRTLGRCTGTADISLNEHSRENVAREIASGLIPGAEQVFECIPGETCRDITPDIAELVRNLIVKEQEPIDYDMANWLHKVLGTGGIPWPQAAE